MYYVYYVNFFILKEVLNYEDRDTRQWANDQLSLTPSGKRVGVLTRMEIDVVLHLFDSKTGQRLAELKGEICVINK